ncbi:MAG: lamin tail domain-containing protein [Akkermansiaceae bacterium]
MHILTHALAASALLVSLHGAPVINEIHYNNDDNTVLNEFVEIYNPDAVEADLSGWELDGAVKFSFAAKTTIPSGGYLVIADDPATIAREFGITAIGPYEGGLNSKGELLQLLDASGGVIDRVDYGVGFPWPSRAKGEGSSMELINPTLDNDLGSSWRSSSIGFNGSKVVFVSEGETWRYRKGTSEASSPIHDWTRINFNEDDTWLTGAGPLGRNEPLVVTNLQDAQGNYASVFLRKSFTFNGAAPSSALLKVLYDDGVIVWLNGTEIYRSDSVGAGVIDYQGNTPANAGGNSTAISSDEQDGYEEYNIGGTANLFREGENVLSIQVFNASIGSSDILIDAALETPEPFSEPAPPSPGRPNNSSNGTPPPNIRQVAHSPAEPASSDPVTISAKVTDPDGVESVTLEYQIVAPGAYVRLSDSAYETSWTEVQMIDQNEDSTYSAEIPAQSHRHLVRYRITVTDSLNSLVRVPFDDDEQPNFAYFVYDGIPAWSGATRPGVDAPQTFPPFLLDDLPAYHLIANATDVTTCQYSNSAENTRFLGTLVYDGVVYDHIEYKIRGEFSTYQSGKNKWRFFFKPAREFEARDNYGNKYQEPWDELTMNANASPWAAVNRGMSGLDEALSYRAFQVAGMASPNTNYLHFRVIDEAAESFPTDQYRGDLWGLYLAVEQPDGSFLEERDLSDGNTYKIEGGGVGTGDKKHQAPNQPTNSSDWTAFSGQSGSRNTVAWWRENLDLDSYYTFRTLNRALGNVDLRDGWNHYFYHSSNPDGTPGKWVPLPWDLDMMYIAKSHQGNPPGTIRQRNALTHSELSIEFKNRSREILDLMLDDSSPTGGQIGQLIDEYSQIANPIGENQTWSDIDRSMWNYHPRTRASGSAQTNHRGNFHAPVINDTRFGGSWTRTLETPDYEGSKNYVLGYLTDTHPTGNWTVNNGDQRGYGYNYVASEAADSAIPETPTIAYTGEAGFPTSGLAFESSTFSDPQGAGSFGAMEWRIAEISAPDGEPGSYEIQAGWESGEITDFMASVDPPASATRPDRTYRARVRHRDNTGRWSHWSAPIEFQSSAPNISDLQQSLVISEIMFNPDGDDATEYIELFNSGDTDLDLTDVRFTKGIDYDFPEGFSLATGSYIIIAKNSAAFQAKYGNDLPLAPGEYDDDSLSNGGELLKLSLGTLAIHEFEFDDDLPWPDLADGKGYSLVLSHITDQTALTPQDPLGHGQPLQWRTSSEIDGSPGESDPTETLVGDPNADEDADGFDALLEYFFGTSNKTPSDPMTVTVSGGQASLTFPINPLADDVSYLVEFTDDLDHWTILSNVTANTGTSLTYATDLATPQDKLFFRVRVQQVQAIPR